MSVPRIPRESWKFKKGERKIGRKKGVPNKITSDLQEVLWMAGEMFGSDGKGTDGILGCIYGIIRDRPESYAHLLEKAFLPKQVVASVVTSEPKDAPQKLSREELVARLRERGIDIESINLHKSQFASDQKALGYNGHGPLGDQS